MNAVSTWDSPEFREALDTSEDLLALTTSAGQCIWINEAGAQVLGRPRSEIVGQPLNALLASRAEALHGDGSLVAGGATSIPLDATTTLVRQPGLGQLVPGRVMRQLFELVNIGMFARDADAGLRWWSRAYWEIVGRTPRPEPPTPEQVLEWVHPDDRERFGRWLSGTGATATNERFRFIRPDGSVRTARVFRLLPDAERRSYGVGMVQDLTESIETLDYARQRDMELETIFAVSPRAMFVADGTGVIRRTNPAASTTFGWDTSELVGQNITMLVPEGDAH